MIIIMNIYDYAIYDYFIAHKYLFISRFKPCLKGRYEGYYEHCGWTLKNPRLG